MDGVLELDLHGIKHEDVDTTLIRFIERNWSSGKECKIITGHSEKMKELVSETLAEYKLEYKTFKANYPYITTIFE